MAARVTAFVVFAIVAVTFVAGLIVGAQREDDSGPVDLIVYNARVYTGNPESAFAEAIAVRGNRILRVGSNRDIKRLMRRATTVIDAHGGTVTAGFHDGSVDLKAAGLALEQAAAGSAQAQALTPAATEAAAPAAAAATTSATTAARADRVLPVPSQAPMQPAPAVPAAPAQTAVAAGARDAAPATTTVAAGQAEGVEAGEAGDTLAAILRSIEEMNRVGVTSVDVTARTPDDLLPYDTLLRTRELTARVTAALTADWPLDEAAVARLDTTRRRYEDVPFFKVEGVRLTVSDGLEDGALTPTASDAAGARQSAHEAQAGGRAATRPAVKPLARAAGRSGAAGAGAAAAAAVAEPQTTAELAADLGRTIALLERRGWQVILQTQDAGDTDLALSALESIAAATASAPGADSGATTAQTETRTDRPRPRRVRIELGRGVEDAAVARLTKLGVIASVKKPGLRQPSAVAAANAAATGAVPVPAAVPMTAAAAAEGATMAKAGAGTDADAAASGPQGDAADPTTAAGAEAGEAAADAEAPAEAEAPESWAYANLLAGVGPFVFHSGWPIAPIDPRFALSAILLDTLVLTEGDGEKKAPDSDSLARRLGRAIDAYTRYAAYASADEHRRGTIAKEMLADLVIFSTDIFSLPPDKLLDAEVTTTIFDGKVVFTRPEPAAPDSTQ